MDKRRLMKRIASDQRGATAVEYGLICAMIVLAMVAALRGVADANTNMWGNVSGEFQNNT